MSLLRSLKTRPFALFWTGQLISRLGDSLYVIAIAWWIADRTGSPEAMGRALAFAFLPRLVFLLLGGVLGDRLPRLGLLLGTDLAQGVLIAVVSLLTLMDRLEIGMVFAISLLTGLLAALALPAYTAIIPDLVPESDLTSANSLMALSAHLTGIAGPALGALLVQQAGYPAAFGLNALSFFISAGFLFAMRSSLPADRYVRAGSMHLWRDIREGGRFVMAHVWLWLSLLVLLLVNFTGRSTMNVALPFLVEQNTGGGVGALALLQSSFAVGSVLGALWLGKQAHIAKKVRLFFATLLFAGLCTLLLGLPLPLVALLVAMLLMGSCLAVHNLAWSVILQSHIPRTMLGRVASLSNLSSTALLPVGFALVGAATSQFGAPLIFIVGGALTALLAMLGLAFSNQKPPTKSEVFD